MSKIICSAVGEKDVLTIDSVIDKRGFPVYRVSWFRDGKWTYVRYDSFKDAYNTMKMIASNI